MGELWIQDYLTPSKHWWVSEAKKANHVSQKIAVFFHFYTRYEPKILIFSSSWDGLKFNLCGRIWLCRIGCKLALLDILKLRWCSGYKGGGVGGSVFDYISHGWDEKGQEAESNANQILIILQLRWPLFGRLKIWIRRQKNHNKVDWVNRCTR